MYKIFMTVRNRLAITTKCVTALTKHSKLPFNLYIYDNLSNTNIPERFMYYSILYQKGIVSQVTINTKDSTYGAFSKVVASNDFGLHHEMDPQKGNYEFLVLLDNDIIVCPGWDEILRNAWLDIRKFRLNTVKVIGQNPGGIKSKKEIPQKIAGHTARLGKYGGSGLWCVQPNFFKEVGFLEVPKFVGINKRHDQEYWRKLDKVSGSQNYIVGLDAKIGIHCGKYAGSICNVLTRTKDEKAIDFRRQEEEIDKLSFDEFYSRIVNDRELVKDW
jgi:hypothetical protein